MFQLDTEKMPLGKLSKKQIKSGYKVLSELLNLLEKGAANQNKIIDATNRSVSKLLPKSTLACFPSPIQRLGDI